MIQCRGAIFFFPNFPDLSWEPNGLFPYTVLQMKPRFPLHCPIGKATSKQCLEDSVYKKYGRKLRWPLLPFDNGKAHDGDELKYLTLLIITNTFKHGKKNQTHQIAGVSSNVAFGHDTPKDGGARTYILDSLFYFHPLHLCEMCTRWEDVLSGRWYFLIVLWGRNTCTPCFSAQKKKSKQDVGINQNCTWVIHSYT